MTIASNTPTHPLLACAEAIHALLDDTADADPLYLPPDQLRQTLLALARAEERLTAVRTRVQAAADPVADAEGARDAGAVLAHATRRDRRKVAAEQHLATALAQRWTATGQAWRDGEVNGEQAAAITQALDRLPAWVDAAQLAKAEAHLLGEAAHHDPHGLRLLGRRLWEVLCPEEAEEHERRALEAEEAAAAAATRLRLQPLGDGSTRLSARIPDHIAARLAALLEAHTSPRRDHLTGQVRDEATGDRLPADRLRGQAFCTLLEHADPDQLPRHGHTATTLVVTIRLDDLVTGLGAGLLGDDTTMTTLSPGQVRRLACQADLVPAVLGTDSEVLDLGRTARLFSPAQRKALAVRDRHCQAHGCTIPAAWCEAHHLHPWSSGGRTDLADGVLLCSYHHHRIHDPGYHHQRAPDGYRFHRRT